MLLIDALDNRTQLLTVRRQVTASTPPTPAVPATACSSQPNIAQVTVNELTEWLEQAEDLPYLIDVREPQEYAAFNLGGVNIPLPSLVDNLAELPVAGTVVFCCASGQRSLAAAALLQATGFKGEIYNLRGGVFG
jgi:adenylyltransferase/sulfurtransferase